VLRNGDAESPTSSRKVLELQIGKERLKKRLLLLVVAIGYHLPAKNIFLLAIASGMELLAGVRLPEIL
jgi:hypothetical protein